MYTWGWRIPFLLGAPFGLIGYYVRSHLLESREFHREKEMGSIHEMPFIKLLRKYPKNFLVILLLYLS